MGWGGRIEVPNHWSHDNWRLERTTCWSYCNLIVSALFLFSILIRTWPIAFIMLFISWMFILLHSIKNIVVSLNKYIVEEEELCFVSCGISCTLGAWTLGPKVGAARTNEKFKVDILLISSIPSSSFFFIK